MARHRHARLPQLFEALLRVRGRRITPEQRLEDLERYITELATALDDVLRDFANTGNVNANSALVVNEGESLPTVSEDLIGRIIIQRIAATQSRYWYVADDAVGSPTYFELTPGGGGGGDSIQVNAVAVSDANFNDTTPAAVGTGRNVFFQRSGSGPDSVSAYMNLFTALLAGIVPASGGGTTNFLRADATWAAPPAGGGGSATTIEVDLGATAKWSGRFTITDAAISAASKVLCWQAPGPYTGKGTRADEAEMQPVSVISVAPAAGSAVVSWQTPPGFVAEPIVPNGRRDTPSTVAGFDPRYPYQDQVVRRKGLVRGNVKFSYLVMS